MLLSYWKTNILQSFLIIGCYLFVINFVTSLLLAKLFAKLSEKRGMVDYPGPRKIHHYPIPLSGGSQIFFTLLMTIVVNLLLCYLYVIA